MSGYKSCISGHLVNLLDPDSDRPVIDNIVDGLSPISESFDAIAVRGMSGALVVHEVAARLNKNIILVRKDVLRYTPFKVEGPKDGRYVILDDLICTGATIRNICEDIRSNLCEHSRCVGIYLWLDNRLITNKEELTKLTHDPPA